MLLKRIETAVDLSLRFRKMIVLLMILLSASVLRADNRLDNNVEREYFERLHTTRALFIRWVHWVQPCSPEIKKDPWYETYRKMAKKQYYRALEKERRRDGLF